MPLSLRPPRIRPWTRQKVETVGRYWVFDVFKAEMLLPNGQPCPRPIYTFGCSDWCNVLAVTPENEAIFVWQYRHGTDAASLEIPGGVIDAGESPIHGAARELREETGYVVDALEPLLTVHPNPALQGNTHHAFLARGARLAGAPRFDDTEECEVALIPVADLPALIDEGHVTHALCVVVLERFLRTRR